jgi:hypothetical protein
MSQARFLRTDEHEEAVRSLEWVEIQARLLTKDPYQWKWVLISLHNTVQGMMVLSLWKGNGLLALRDTIAAKWLKAYQEDGVFPLEKMDDFLGLYRKIKDRKNISQPFDFNETHDASFTRLNSIRNEFTHFTPKGWSLELEGLPHICCDVLDVVQFLGCESAAIHWYKKTHKTRVKRALKQLRQSMTLLARQYAT